MEIVIDIDENVFTRLFDNGTDFYDTDDILAMAKAIRKGTPLPKGHGDLVDVNEVEEYLNDIQFELDGWGETDGALEIAKARMGLDSVSTIIEADKAESEDKV